MARWSVPIDSLVKRANGRVDLVVRKATMDLFAAAVRRSPVATGRFRANWNVSYGAPDVTVSAATNGSRGEAQARKALTLPVGGIVYLVNALPYGGRLEAGSSKQAPSGMVRVSAVEWSAKVASANRS